MQLRHMLDKVRGKKNIKIVEPLLKENNSYNFNEKEISDILKKTHFDKKTSSFDNFERSSECNKRS